ncbi:hypothetical protein LEMLEM_LOCUS11442, partial [Lemmus lemmus]
RRPWLTSVREKCHGKGDGSQQGETSTEVRAQHPRSKSEQTWKPSSPFPLFMDGIRDKQAMPLVPRYIIPLT